MHAFPSVVQVHLDKHYTSSAQPNEIFDIAIAAFPGSLGPHPHGVKFDAYLTYGDLTDRKSALRCYGGVTIEETLMKLLVATCRVLDKKVPEPEDKVTIEEGKEVDAIFVAGELLEDVDMDGSDSEF